MKVENKVVYYIKPSYWYVIVFSVINIIGYGYLFISIPHFFKFFFSYWGWIFLVLSYLTAQNDTNSITLTTDRLIIHYPLRPIMRSVTYELDGLLQFRFYNRTIRVLGPVVVLLYQNRRRSFSYNGKAKRMHELMAHLETKGINAKEVHDSIE